MNGNNNESGEITLDTRTVEEQANDWFTLMQSGACSQSDITAHKAWFNANPLHRKAYKELEDVWSMLGNFADRPEILTMRAEARKQLQGAKSPSPRSQAKPHFFSSRRWLPMALAASLLIVFVGTHISDGNLWNPNIYQTKVGGQKTLTLDDGSTLVLDTQTKVITQFTPERRHIVLEKGQARFDVFSDKTRPFEVEAGNGTVTALGTAFLVRKSSDEVLVTLIEGTVSVEQNPRRDSTDGNDNGNDNDSTTARGQVPRQVLKQALQLKAGQQVSYSEINLSAATEVDLEQATAWQEGRLVFEDESLVKVLKDLNRYSHNQIIIGDSALENVKITGVFKTGDNQKVVQTLKKYFAVRVSNDRYGNLILTPVAKIPTG